MFGAVLLSLLLDAWNVPMDFITFSLLCWNFSVVGLVPSHLSFFPALTNRILSIPHVLLTHLFLSDCHILVLSSHPKSCLLDRNQCTDGHILHASSRVDDVDDSGGGVHLRSLRRLVSRRSSQDVGGDGAAEE